MKPIPRKLLIVAKPDESFILMLEIADRSHSYNIPRDLGVEILDGVMDAVFEILAQRSGFTVGDAKRSRDRAVNTASKGEQP